VANEQDKEFNVVRCGKCTCYKVSDICWHCEFDRVQGALEKAGAVYIKLADAIDRFEGDDLPQEIHENDYEAKYALLRSKRYFLDETYGIIEEAGK